MQGDQSELEEVGDQAKRPVEPALEALIRFAKKTKVAAEGGDQPGSSAMAKAVGVVAQAAHSASPPHGSKKKKEVVKDGKKGKTKSGL